MTSYATCCQYDGLEEHITQHRFDQQRGPGDGEVFQVRQVLQRGNLREFVPFLSARRELAWSSRFLGDVGTLGGQARCLQLSSAHLLTQAARLEHEKTKQPGCPTG